MVGEDEAGVAAAEDVAVVFAHDFSGGGSEGG